MDSRKTLVFLLPVVIYQRISACDQTERERGGKRKEGDRKRLGHHDVLINASEA